MVNKRRDSINFLRKITQDKISYLGTAHSKDYFIDDDMLFLTRTKQNRAGQSKESYRWPAGRIPFTFAPGYCKFKFIIWIIYEKHAIIFF